MKKNIFFHLLCIHYGGVEAFSRQWSRQHIKGAPKFLGASHLKTPSKTQARESWLEVVAVRRAKTLNLKKHMARPVNLVSKFTLVPFVAGQIKTFCKFTNVSRGISNERSSLSKALAICGGAIEDKYLLDRVDHRIGALDVYIIVATLIMNAALCLFSYTDHSLEDEKKTGIEKKLIACFSFFTMISVVTGTYCSLVFTLCSLYLRTIMGFGYDEKLLSFVQATKTFRLSGFRSFLISLWSFMISFLFSLRINMGACMTSNIVVASATVMTAVATMNVQQLLSIASTVIFQSTK